MAEHAKKQDGQIIRSAKRFNTQAVDCELGRILDLSDAGMRVECKGSASPLQPGQTGSLTLNQNGSRITVQAETRWVKRRGLFKYEAGMMFFDVQEDAKRKLGQLAKFSFLCDDEVYENLSQNSIIQYTVNEPVKASFALPNYYKILNINSTANENKIKSSYLELIELYDGKNNAQDNATQIRLLKEAYGILSDPNLKQAYDSMMHNT
ncbi:DnaJ domain-containing protein [Planctomycetota bacterium]|nr:DnaJ domain-containing protein [Planctomycetota bacterium]